MWENSRFLTPGWAILAALFAAASPQAARSDILHLRDGSRHYGELISEMPREIAFRVVTPGGASAIRRFAAETVERVERTTETAPPSADAPQHEKEPFADADLAQMLREAYELLDDDDRPAALRALQRLVTLAPNEILEALDADCLAQRGRSIGQLLAEERLAAALVEAEKGGTFRLRGVTRIERDYLGQLLEQQTNERLDLVYSGRTIAEWSAGVVAYKELKPDSRKLVADTKLAAGLITARVRHDPRLYNKAEERKRLTQMRNELARFAARVMALRGYTSAPPAEESEHEWFRRNVGRGGTLLRSFPGAPTTQPTTRPADESVETERTEPDKPKTARPPARFPEEEDEP